MYSEHSCGAVDSICPTAQIDVDGSIIFHVTCMCLAWLLLAPFALLTARLRHFKSFEQRLNLSHIRPSDGRPYWYLVHRACMVGAVLLTLIGGFAILTRPQAQLESSHALVGVVILVLACAQVSSRLG